MILKCILATNITEENGQNELDVAKKSAEWTEKIGACAKEFFDAKVKACKADMSKCEFKDETDCGTECDKEGRRHGKNNFW